MEEKNLTQQESLELISRMIKESRMNLEKGGGNIYLLWGYLWLVTALAVFFTIRFTGDYRAYWLWFAMPLIGYPSMIYLIKKAKKPVVTFVDKTISKIWIVLGICALLLSLYQLVDYSAFPILFVMALLINIGVTVSGLIIRFNPLIIAGFTGIVLSFLLLRITGAESILISGLFSVIMLIIPGHILNYASKKHNAKYHV